MWPQLLSCQLELLGGEVCCLRVTIISSSYVSLIAISWRDIQKKYLRHPSGQGRVPLQTSPHTAIQISRPGRGYHHIMLFRWMAYFHSCYLSSALHQPQCIAILGSPRNSTTSSTTRRGTSSTTRSRTSSTTRRKKAPNKEFVLPIGYSALQCILLGQTGTSPIFC